MLKLGSLIQMFIKHENIYQKFTSQNLTRSIFQKVRIGVFAELNLLSNSLWKRKIRVKILGLSINRAVFGLELNTAKIPFSSPLTLTVVWLNKSHTI